MVDTTEEEPLLLAPPMETADSPRARAVRALLLRKAAVFGLLLIVLFTGLALLAPVIAPYDPTAQSWANVRKAPSLASLTIRSR